MKAQSDEPSRSLQLYRVTRYIVKPNDTMVDVGYLGTSVEDPRHSEMFRSKNATPVVARLRCREKIRCMNHVLSPFPSKSSLEQTPNVL